MICFPPSEILLASLLSLGAFDVSYWNNIHHMAAAQLSQKIFLFLVRNKYLQSRLVYLTKLKLCKKCQQNQPEDTLVHTVSCLFVLSYFFWSSYILPWQMLPKHNIIKTNKTESNKNLNKTFLKIQEQKLVFFCLFASVFVLGFCRIVK